MAIQFYCLDLETNGLMVDFHEICELSILRASDRVQLSRQVKVDKPQNSNIDALKITNKTLADLAKGISKSQLVSDVDLFVDEDGLSPASRCLVGHNIIGFDKKFLWSLWEKEGRKFPFDFFVDTMHLSKAYTKKLGMVKPKHNLQVMCDTVGIKKVAGNHNAVSDTRNCYLLWKKLMESIDYLDHIKRLPHMEEDGE